MVRNVLGLDTEARIYAIKNALDSKIFLPVLALFDFFAAFPSVAHQWLFSILKLNGAPARL